jgi:hypothetical protein
LSPQPDSSILIGLVALATACGGDRASPLATPLIDTLPGGIIRVINPGPTAWTDTSGWKLVETLRIRGSLGDTTVLYDPVSVALDGEGRIWVMDKSPMVIKVFANNGNLVRTVGRQGGGPGEFMAGSLAIVGGNVVVHDQNQGRTSVFDTAGRFLRSWPSPCCYANRRWWTAPG